MTDLKDALQPLLDQPPAEPEPLAALEARSRGRRRRRRASLAAGVVSAVAAIALAVGTLWPSGDGASRIDTVGPTDPDSAGVTEPADPHEDDDPLSNPPPDAPIIAQGEIDGVPWYLKAWDTGDGSICADVLGGGATCYGTSGTPIVALTRESSFDAGDDRATLHSVYGPIRRDVVRIELRTSSGEVMETTPVGQDAGFPVNLFIFRPAIEMTGDDTFEIIAYDADGEELEREGPFEMGAIPPEPTPSG